MAIKSQQELYEGFIGEVQSQDPSLTDDNEGSKLDVLAGAMSTAGREIQSLIVEEFAKTFVDTANGPEITGGPDDLQRLLVDHFGDAFARRGATKATGIVTFSRANTDEGDVEILAGTIVKTPANAAGNSQRFEVLSSVTLSGLSINASVRAIVAGVAGNVQAGQVTQIETALSDPSVVVTNSDVFSQGTETQTDAEYRQYARELLKTLGGGSIEAIVAAAKTVPGVVFATGIEFVRFVKEWDVAEDEGIGDYFRIVFPVLFIGDANGEASDSLKAAVEEAIEEVRAAGVKVIIRGITPITLNWTLEVTLDSGGPNFTALSEDMQPVLDTMLEYLQSLGAGEDFIKATAEAYIMSRWGPSGTEDVTAVSTTVPAGNVSVEADEQIIPGTLEIA